eukprot:767569-Hanusia_phi.AAC.6
MAAAWLTMVVVERSRGIHANSFNFVSWSCSSANPRQEGGALRRHGVWTFRRLQLRGGRPEGRARKLVVGGQEKHTPLRYDLRSAPCTPG